MTILLNFEMPAPKKRKIVVQKIVELEDLDPLTMGEQ